MKIAIDLFRADSFGTLGIMIKWYLSGKWNRDNREYDREVIYIENNDGETVLVREQMVPIEPIKKNDIGIKEIAEEILIYNKKNDQTILSITSTGITPRGIYEDIL